MFMQKHLIDIYFIAVYLLSFLLWQGLKNWHAFSYLYSASESFWKLVENV